MKGRPREKWLETLKKQDARGVGKELRARGFDAVVIHRAGFPDDARGVESAFLEASGTKRLIPSPAGKESCILLDGGS